MPTKYRKIRLAAAQRQRQTEGCALRIRRGSFNLEPESHLIALPRAGEWVAFDREAVDNGQPCDADAEDPLCHASNSDSGFFETIAAGIAQGWALSQNDRSAPATVHAIIDGDVVGKCIADSFRADLFEASIQNGYAAFSYAIPLKYFDGKPHSVSFAVEGSSGLLGNCPQEFTATRGSIPFLQEKITWAKHNILLRGSPRFNLLAKGLATKRRLAILSTFHTARRFLSYHLSLAEALVEAGFIVHIVHAAATDIVDDLEEIDKDDVFLTIKKNLGYDFGSWALGVFQVADELAEAEELLLINDSVIGPAFDLNPLLERVRRTKADLVGLTDSFERAYHLQSYFLWFGPEICRLPILQSFMAKYPFVSDKEVVIEQGEFGLTKFFMDQGFELEAVFPYELVAGTWLDEVPNLIKCIESLPAASAPTSNREHCASFQASLLEKLDLLVASVVNGKPLNPTHFFWDVLLTKFRFPFLKRELLFENPADIPTYHRISEVLSPLSPRLLTNVLELRRYYGGSRAPFVRPPAAGRLTSTMSARAG